MAESPFEYRDGVLHVEDVDIPSIAAAVGTPFYVYAQRRLIENYRAFAACFEGMKVMICYAVKANVNGAVIKTLIDCGAGADVTSAGELERALAAGAAPEKIIYSGVGKRPDEIMAALLANVHQINVESIPELHAISRVATSLDLDAPIAIRVNPDVTARTYEKTSTGELSTKFGIGIDQLDDALRLARTLPHLTFKGFQIHIGSHVHDYEPFREAFQKLAARVEDCRSKGIKVDHLDLGGGVGIPYDGQSLAPFRQYADIVRETVGHLGCELSFEPGRRLVGDAGLLISKIIYDKKTPRKRFLIVDAGMNDLVRPAMYGARHSIKSVIEKKEAQAIPADVVGPVCETSDLFGEDYKIEGVTEGDLIAIGEAGAYGSAMASAYNGRALIPEILVSGSQFAVVRRRIAVAEQMSWEAFAPWSTAKDA